MVDPISSSVQPGRGGEGGLGLAPRAAIRPSEDSEFGGLFHRTRGGAAGVNFSSHALRRLDDRHIELTQGDRLRIASAIDSAKAKAARESLLLMDELALVVNVPNRTVVTALAPHMGKDSVFTNIDSVVLVARAAETA